MLIEWNDSLVVGYPAMDDEHKSLVALINWLHECVQTGNSRVEIDEALFSLADHVAAHFSHENEMMLASNYPERPAHLLEHRTLIDEFDTLLDSVDLLTDEQLRNAMSFIRVWFTDHVRNSDTRLGRYLARPRTISPDR